MIWEKYVVLVCITCHIYVCGISVWYIAGRRRLVAVVLFVLALKTLYILPPKPLKSRRFHPLQIYRDFIGNVQWMLWRVFPFSLKSVDGIYGNLFRENCVLIYPVSLISGWRIVSLRYVISQRDWLDKEHKLLCLNLKRLNFLYSNKINNFLLFCIHLSMNQVVNSPNVNFGEGQSNCGKKAKTTA